LAGISREFVCFAPLEWQFYSRYRHDFAILRVTTREEYRIKEPEGTAEAGRIIEREMRAIVNNVNAINKAGCVPTLRESPKFLAAQLYDNAFQIDKLVSEIPHAYFSSRAKIRYDTTLRIFAGMS